MNLIRSYLKKFRSKLDFIVTNNSAVSSTVLTLAACGGSSDDSKTKITGFPVSYVGPAPNYNPSDDIDPFSEKLLDPVITKP